MCGRVGLNRCRSAVSQSQLLAVVSLTAVTLACFGQAQAQESSIEENLKVHRITTDTTSPYDAFAYINRVPTEPSEGETVVGFAGMVIFSRLGNQEGRIEVKLVEGIDRSGYLGYKTFMRAWPDEENGVGNCVVCHTPPGFTNGKKYITNEFGVANIVPSLRNLRKSDKEIETIIQQQVKMSELARAGEAKDIEEAYAIIRLGESDVKDLISFISSLNEVSKEKFRDIILKAEVLDTSDLLN